MDDPVAAAATYTGGETKVEARVLLNYKTESYLIKTCLLELSPKPLVNAKAHLIIIISDDKR